MGVRRQFDRFAAAASQALAHPAAFVLAASGVVVWAALGPVFHYSETWQMLVNTGTTIITFLMVFVLQSSSTRENAAMNAKLDELIVAIPAARNDLVAAEAKLGDEIAALRVPAPP